jgi:hypothetical protein
MEYRQLAESGMGVTQKAYRAENKGMFSKILQKICY